MTFLERYATYLGELERIRTHRTTVTDPAVSAPDSELTTVRASGFIAKGTYGCAFRRAIPCVTSGLPPGDTVAKIFKSQTEANSEMVQLLAMATYDPDNAFTVKVHHACKVPRRLVPELQCFGITEHASERGSSSMHEIVMDYGGVALNDFSVLLHSTFKDIFGFLKNVFQGMATMQGLRICHADIKPHNVLVDRDRKRGNLIDFGMLTPYEHSPYFSSRLSERHGQYVYYPSEVAALTVTDGAPVRSQHVNRFFITKCNHSFEMLVSKTIFISGMGTIDDRVRNFGAEVLRRYHVDLSASLPNIVPAERRLKLETAMRNGTYNKLRGLAITKDDLHARLDVYGMGCSLLSTLVSAHHRGAVGENPRTWLGPVFQLISDMLSPVPQERPDAVKAQLVYQDVMRLMGTGKPRRAGAATLFHRPPVLVTPSLVSGSWLPVQANRVSPSVTRADAAAPGFSDGTPVLKLQRPGFGPPEPPKRSRRFAAGDIEILSLSLPKHASRAILTGSPPKPASHAIPPKSPPTPSRSAMPMASLKRALPETNDAKQPQGGVLGWFRKHIAF